MPSLRRTSSFRIEASSGVTQMTGSFVLFRDDLARRERLFAHPVEIIQADTADEVIPALYRIEDARAAGHWCAGYLSYEAGYALNRN